MCSNINSHPKTGLSFSILGNLIAIFDLTYSDGVTFKQLIDFQPNEGGSELTLDEMVGLFYILLVGLLVALIVVVIEHFYYRRTDAAKANIPIKTALRAKSRLEVNEVQEPRNTKHCRRQEQDRGWNGSGTAPGSYAGVSIF